MTIIKLLFTLSLIFQVLSAQSSVHIWNQHPVVGDEIVVFHLNCYSPEESIVDIDGQSIKVFARYDPPPNFICGSPPPVRTITLINGLSEGVYNLEYYRLTEPISAFPPLPVDYSLYFGGSVQFEVFGRPIVVDSTSNLSLILLFTLILFAGLFLVKKNKVNLVNRVI